MFFVILLAAILHEELFIFPLVKQKRIVFAASNSMCCKCLVAPTIIWSEIVGQIQLYKPNLNGRFPATQNHKKMRENILLLTFEALTVGATNIGSADYSALTMRYSHNSMC